MDSKGLYTVKSAYRLEVNDLTRYNPSPSKSSVMCWWNALWSSDIPPKIKIFWWRIIHNIIPTSWNLRNNHIPAFLECKLCDFGYETTSHALFWCPLVKHMWKNSVFGDCLQVIQLASIVELVTWVRHCWDKEQVEVFIEYRRCRQLVRTSGSITGLRDTKWTAPLRSSFQLDIDAGSNKMNGSFTARGII
ncbi:hypothetical protein UlMin_033405 [Ulmus minor]